jgi:hypothetical protein
MCITYLICPPPGEHRSHPNSTSKHHTSKPATLPTTPLLCSSLPVPRSPFLMALASGIDIGSRQVMMAESYPFSAGQRRMAAIDSIEDIAYGSVSHPFSGQARDMRC